MFNVGQKVKNRVQSSDSRIENEVGTVTATQKDILFGYEERFGRRFPVIADAITVSFPSGIVHTCAPLSHYVAA